MHQDKPHPRTEFSAPGWPPGAAGAATAPTAAAPLAALLTRHILQDGELILIVLKPSLWFILLSMLRWAAFVFIVMSAAVVFHPQMPGPVRIYVELGIVVLVVRFTVAILQWMSRLYILTDLRIVRISGVFSLDIFDCPLRKVARTRMLYTMRERLLALGSIEIIPADEEYPICTWQTVPKPLAVHDQIIAAINRAKQGRSCANGG